MYEGQAGCAHHSFAVNPSLKVFVGLSVVLNVNFILSLSGIFRLNTFFGLNMSVIFGLNVSMMFELNVDFASGFGGPSFLGLWENNLDFRLIRTEFVEVDLLARSIYEIQENWKNVSGGTSAKGGGGGKAPTA